MSKLFKLKKWLTLQDSARHLTLAFGEDFSETDVLQLVMAGTLEISVFFPNNTKGFYGVLVPRDDVAECDRTPELSLDGIDTVYKYSGPMILDDDGWGVSMFKRSDSLSNLQGLYDLPIFDGGMLEVQREYQRQTAGSEIVSVATYGVFVKNDDGQLCQLQSDQEDEYQADTIAQLRVMKNEVAGTSVEPKNAEAMLVGHIKERNLFLEKRAPWSAPEYYFPASRLPSGFVFVIRTEVLRDFEMSNNDMGVEASIAGNAEPESKNHRGYLNGKMEKMIQASHLFWGNADRNEKDTHLDNKIPAKWFVEQGFSSKQANSAASLIRPEWAAMGRKPEK